MRAIRIELLIATLALLASAAASIATVVQTRVVGNQLSASVWPYVSLNATLGRDDVRLDAVNDGLGPALVRSVTLRLDGRRQQNWRGAFAALARDVRASHPQHAVKASAEEVGGIGPTSVIRAGESFQLIHVHAALANQVGTPDGLRFQVTMCYCSLLGQCWIAVEDSRTQPAAVSSCGPALAELDY